MTTPQPMLVGDLPPKMSVGLKALLRNVPPGWRVARILHNAGEDWEDWIVEFRDETGEIVAGLPLQPEREHEG